MEKNMEILLIEDNPGDVRLIEEMLKDARNILIKITNSIRLDEALKLLDRETFDMVLLDLGLPDCQGLETYRQVSAHAQKFPIVILSGLTDEDVALKAIQEGAQEYILKGEMTSSSLSRLIKYSVERKLICEALRESERILRNILENSTNVFFSHTADQTFTYLSPQITSFLGYTPNEARIKWTELASDNPINEEGLRYKIKALETGIAQPPYELELVKKNGDKIWVEVHEAPVIENDIISIVGALTDITERKIAEQELIKYKDHLEELVKERTQALEVQKADLENMNKLFVGREFRIKELRDQLKEFKAQIERVNNEDE
ncbi:MAG: response regulator [Candidatus Cloacimonetes bacterium]|nr:response regulator [Candidatus Cloacimonadota bacterium]